MNIDWTQHLKYSENTCYCGCGAVFRSHAKTVLVGEQLRLFSRLPCPECGKDDDLRRISSDPEVNVIKSK